MFRIARCFCCAEIVPFSASCPMARYKINGKAVMVSELYCDGLGDCIGEWPVGAIELEEREAEPYDKEVVMERLIPKGEEVIVAHF